MFFIYFRIHVCIYCFLILFINLVLFQDFVHFQYCDINFRGRFERERERKKESFDSSLPPKPSKPCHSAPAPLNHPCGLPCSVLSNGNFVQIVAHHCALQSPNETSRKSGLSLTFKLNIRNYA
jgi:hypothetical protein